ncbi:MAG: potassium channel family protein [Pseudomonadota bacterium]
MLRLISLNRYSFLLVSLVFVYLVTPLFDSDERINWATEIGIVFVTALCIVSVISSKRHRYVALALGVPLIVFSVCKLFLFPDALGPSRGGLFYVLFFSFILVVHLRWLLTTHIVDEEVLAGAVNIYLLLGLIFGFVYTTIYASQPGAFLAKTQDVLDFNDFVYASMVTLTTVGYGDIVPVSQLARASSTFQALLGQLYLAILVARFVAMYTSSQAGKGG